MIPGITLYQRDKDGVMRNVGWVVSWYPKLKSIMVAGQLYTLIEDLDEKVFR